VGYCALFFITRQDFELVPQRVHARLKRFDLLMHTGRGAEATKTNAMFFRGIRGFVRNYKGRFNRHLKPWEAPPTSPLQTARLQCFSVSSNNCSLPSTYV
jgi:hypothetical protein